MDLEGERHWALAGDVATIAQIKPARVARLLPAFDPYVVGSPRAEPAVLAAEHKARVHRPQGWISPVLVVDGRIEGVWSHERREGRLTVTIEPFEPLPDWVRAGATAEAERLAAFFGVELTLDWGSA